MFQVREEKYAGRYESHAVKKVFLSSLCCVLLPQRRL